MRCLEFHLVRSFIIHHSITHFFSRNRRDFFRFTLHWPIDEYSLNKQRSNHLPQELRSWGVGDGIDWFFRRIIATSFSLPHGPFCTSLISSSQAYSFAIIDSFVGVLFYGEHWSNRSTSALIAADSRSVFEAYSRHKPGPFSLIGPWIFPQHYRQ